MKTSKNYNNLPINTVPTDQRMTSLEIAALTGKPHNDVMKAIRKMEPAWVKVVKGRNFSLGSYIQTLTEPTSPMLRTHQNGVLIHRYKVQ